MQNFKTFLNESNYRNDLLTINSIINAGERRPDMESLILKHPHEAVRYAKVVIGGRWPELEKTILDQFPKWTSSMANYSGDIMHCNWPEAEQLILSEKDNSAIYHYWAFGKNSKRWPELEKRMIETKNVALMRIYLYEILDPAMMDLEIAQTNIERDPSSIEIFSRAMKIPLWLQELAVKLGGKKILILIKNPDPELLEQYPEIANLKKSGLFK